MSRTCRLIPKCRQNISRLLLCNPESVDENPKGPIGMSRFGEQRSQPTTSVPAGQRPRDIGVRQPFSPNGLVGKVNIPQRVDRSRLPDQIEEKSN